MPGKNPTRNQNGARNNAPTLKPRRLPRESTTLPATTISATSTTAKTEVTAPKLVNDFTTPKRKSGQKRAAITFSNLIPRNPVRTGRQGREKVFASICFPPTEQNPRWPPTQRSVRVERRI